MCYLTANLDDLLEEVNLPFELAPLQKQDIVTASTAGAFGLFYEVGVGKTVVSTMVAKLWNRDHTVIVCPPILKDQWAEWLLSIGEKDVIIFEGARRTPDMLDHKWVVMSHAIFRDSALTLTNFYKKKDYCLLVDEAQWIKNPASKLYKEVKKFVTPDKNILMLTATPTTKPQDTFTYMKLKSPLLYRSYGHWQNIHVAQTDVFGTITKYANIEMLAENFALEAIVRTKEEVFGHDVRPIYQPIVYKLSTKHQNLYNKLAEEQLLLLPGGNKIDATSAQRLRHALQQIVVNFSNFSGNDKDVSAAFEIVDNTIEEVDPINKERSKLIIWTNYRATSASVTKYLVDKFGARAVVAAYGGVDSAKSIDAIMNDPECRILVAQPRSCGAGLNLQHVCSENLFLEMSTSPMEMKQAMGRTDRIGQKVRPTFRFAQALGTVQISLFSDMLKNDDLTSQVERTPKTLRDEIFGK